MVQQVHHDSIRRQRTNTWAVELSISVALLSLQVAFIYAYLDNLVFLTLTENHISPLNRARELEEEMDWAWAELHKLRGY